MPLPVGLRDRWCEMAPVVGLAPTRTGLKDRALGSLHSRAFDEMAERGGHAPQPAVRIDFLSTESRLARPVHVPLVPTARTPSAKAPPPNAERKLRSGRSRNFACNLRVRSAALYTLSYGSLEEMVRRGGSAPPASAMSVRRSPN